MSVSLTISLSPSPHYLLGRMPFRKLNIACRWKRHRRGVVFVFTIGNARKEKSPRFTFVDWGKKVHRIFLMLILCAGGAVVRGKGQPPYAVGGNTIQSNLSARPFARMYQDP